MPRHQPEFDFGLVEPTAVFRRVVHLQTTPDAAPYFGIEMISEGFAAVNVEIVHYRMDLSRKRIAGDQTFDHLGKLSRRAVGCGAGKVSPGPGPTTAKMLAVCHARV